MYMKVYDNIDTEVEDGEIYSLLIMFVCLLIIYPRFSFYHILVCFNLYAIFQ